MSNNNIQSTNAQKPDAEMRQETEFSGEMDLMREYSKQLNGETEDREERLTSSYKEDR